LIIFQFVELSLIILDFFYLSSGLSGLNKYDMIPSSLLKKYSYTGASLNPRSDVLIVDDQLDLRQTLADILKAISDHIYVTRISDTGPPINLYLSPHITALTGYPLEKFSQDWYFWPSTVIHPDDRAAAAAQAARLIKGEDSEIEYRLVRADGKIIWVRDSGRVKASGPTTKIIYGVVSDITEREMMAAALRQKVDELVALNETSQEFLGQLDVSTTLKSICQLAVEHLGVEMAWVGLVAPDHFRVEPVKAYGLEEGYLQTIQITWDDTTGTAIRTGRPLAVNQIESEPAFARGYASSAALPLHHSNQVLGALNVYSTEPGHFTLDRLQGLQAFANLAAASLQKARLYEQVQRHATELEQRVTERTAELTTSNQQLSREIAERKQIEAALRQSEALYRQMFETHSAIKLLIDPQTGVIVEANQAASDFYGYSRATLKQMKILEINTLPAEVVAQKMQAARLTKHNHFFFKHRLASGEERDVEVYSAPIVVRGQKLLYSIIHDITERRQAEQRVADQTRELVALYDVTAVASAALNLQAVLTQSLPPVLTAMRSQVGIIHLLDEENTNLTPAAQQGLSLELLREPDTRHALDLLTGWIATHSEPLTVPDLATNARTPPLAGLSAYVGAPIRAGGRTLGVLSVFGAQMEQFNPEDVALLASIADQIGVAVENIRLRQQAEQAAIIEERARLARELHDSVTQSLYSLSLLAEAGRRWAVAGDLERVIRQVEEISEIAGQALKEMRLLVYELRPSTLERDGLAGALQQRLDAVEKRSAVKIEFSAEGLPDLPAYIEQGVYRIAQEALNNALKHADATRVIVRLYTHAGMMVLEVVDNGQGFDWESFNNTTTGGMGLVSMRERTEKLGGDFTLHSTPGRGTTVQVRIKL
jgi:PAS domain S-box-containing protein